ncbi:MAG TPA: sugar ABC transporter substrate-binding protein, partial [Acetobacteraceae bacterium]|nr:sugar ABC transporter substrate-binding protein [Acetobacteraceae bacterium]
MTARIAVFTKNRVNPNYQAFFQGASRAAAAAGATATWHTPDTPDHAEQQITLLRQVASERPDAILFAPADDRALEAPVSEVNAAGVPLVGFVNRMQGDFVSFVGSDDTLMGRAIAGVLLDALGGRGKVVLIEGPDSAPTSRDRGQGFREAIARRPEVVLLGTA